MSHRSRYSWIGSTEPLRAEDLRVRGEAVLQADLLGPREDRVQLVEPPVGVGRQHLEQVRLAAAIVSGFPLKVPC